MKKKPYILPKLMAEKVSDPMANWYRDEDERILAELIEESMPKDDTTKTYKRGK